MIQVRANAYKGNKVHPLPIGRLGERDVRTVVFEIDDLKKTYGAGTWAIIARRPGEKEDYPVKTTWESKEGYACWDVSDVDTGKCGQGLVELRYYPSDQSTDRVYKSRLWTTEIEYALGVNYGEVSPYEDIAQRIENAVSEFNSKVGDGKLSISKDGVLIGTFTANQKEDFDINIVQAQANYTETDSNSVSFIRNKPTIGNGKLTIKKDGATLASFNANATKATTVDIIQEQANWNETDTNSVSYIQNKPFIPQDADDVSAIPMSLKGVAGGVAELGNDGYVLSSQLPSYVDDILEYSSVSDFPITGDKGKIYLSIDTSKIYRWTGSRYVEIPVGLVLGETSSTAYRGDRGKIAYEYATRTHSYNELTDKPTIGSGTLTIKKDGTSIGTFGANNTNDSEINIVQDQSDWNETNVNSPSYIANKPTIGTGVFKVIRNGSTVSAFNANQNIDTNFDISDFAAMRVVSQAEYDALSDAEKSSSTFWYIHDATDFETIITLSKEQYDALPENEKNNGLYYYVYDDSVVSPTIVVAQSLENNANSVPSSKVLYDVKTNSDSASRVTETASGEIATFDDGANDYPMDSVVVNIEPVQDLHGYDHPWVGGAGKNKAPMMRSYTNKGITVTVDSDGVVTANGTNITGKNGTVGQSEYATLKAGSYILSGSTAANTGVTIQAVEKVGDTVTVIGRDSTGNGMRFTLEEDALVAVRGYISADAEVSDLKLYPMIRLSTESDTYEPYFNICPISGWDAVSVTRAGKNLLDTSDVETVTRNGVSFVRNSDGSITASGTSTADWQSRLFSGYLPSGSYKLSGGISSSVRLRLGQGSQNTLIGHDSGSELSFTLTEETLISVNIRFANGADANVTIYPMIRLASESDATYEPYQGKTVTTDLTQTVYGGTLDVVSGMLTINTVYEQFTNAVLYGNYGADKKPLYYVTRSSTAEIKPSANLNQEGKLLSNYFVQNTATTTKSMRDGEFRGQDGGSLRFYFRYDSADLNTINTMFETTPLQVIAELATPQTIQLTKQEVTSLLAQNNVWADSGSVSVVYTADMKMYIDSRIQSLIEEGT